MDIVRYFAKDWDGAAFTMFNTPHLIVLGLLALLCAGVIFNRQRFTVRGRHIFRYSLVIVMLLNEISWHIWRLAVGTWNVQDMLPLWICSILIWTIPLLLIKRSYRYYELAYFYGYIAISQALLTPDLGIYGFPHVRFFQFFIGHGGLLLAIVYMTAVEGFRPTWASFGRALVMGNLYWLLVAGVNAALGSNYLYTLRKLDTPSMLDVLGPWPVYLVWMEVLAIIVMLLLYLPFAISDWRRARQPEPA